MVKELYGEKQFKQWRRSYITRPPPTSSFSSVYPGNEVDI
jgi:bisphosphoglycerate-dependent phosphoglycerate mutase